MAQYIFPRKATKKFLYYSIVLIGLSSCVSTKRITYFQSVSPLEDETVIKEATYTPRIKEGDILDIRVSSLDKASNEMFNPVPQIIHYSAQSAGTIAPQPVTGYTVDTAGKIAVPLIGEMPVAGMTSKELATLLTEQLQRYLKSPTVTVRIANYTISVLGEVNRPATYYVPNEQITLPEAIALAGDLTMYGKRKNILIIRETNGSRQFARVDITKRDIFSSPYYYLRSGDVVYVEATAGRLTSTDRVYQLAPVIISSLTLFVLIFNAFIK
ncbi:MAG: polysaccharide biosynthesis/export family protein [Bacteroidales bacterium]|jgi:polysaccharide export outer membrane protein|nr:polysaccharide biosynthesis/export family protein [Bacteroidales bacterium]